MVKAAVGGLQWRVAGGEWLVVGEAVAGLDVWSDSLLGWGAVVALEGFAVDGVSGGLCLGVWCNSG